MAHAVAVRGADTMVLSDPGAAFVPCAVSCCYRYSKQQEIPWSVLSPVESHEGFHRRPCDLS